MINNFNTRNNNNCETLTVIIKVTHGCNLNCRYCSVGDVQDHGIISFVTLKHLFKKISDYCSKSILIWHGGEPLIAGVDFYRKVISLQEEFPNHEFINSLQTNGTLLNENLIDFFTKHDFRIGFSIDGCEESHNLNRPYKNSRPSFKDTLNAYEIIRSRGMHPGAICVLNKNTLKHLTSIYEFAKEKHISFKINPQYPAGRASINVDLGLDNNTIAEAYIKLFDLWYNDDPVSRPPMRFFEQLVHALTSISQGDNAGQGLSCAYKNNCQHHYIAISPTGNIFPCGKFVDEPGFCYGNINDILTLSEILENEIRQRFLFRHNNIHLTCKECKFYSICGSGCPHDSYLWTGDVRSKNPLCSVNQKLYSHIENTLKKDFLKKDIYIEEIKGFDSSTPASLFLVSSPLRRNYFFAGQSAIEELKLYLMYDIPVSNEVLKHYLNNWIRRFPSEKPVFKYNLTDKCVILLTNQCNLACSYCYSKLDRFNNKIDKSKLKIAIDYIIHTNPKHHKYFSFIGGGEPVIDWDMLEWTIKYIRVNQINENTNVSVTTNATLLDEEKIKFFSDNNVEVGVSFDILPDIQNYHRKDKYGNGTYSTVEDAIKKLYKNGVNFRIRTTISSDCVQLMPVMVEYIHSNFPYIKELQLEPVMDASLSYRYYHEYVRYFIDAYSRGKDYSIAVYNLITLSLNQTKSAFCSGEFCVI